MAYFEIDFKALTIPLVEVAEVMGYGGADPDEMTTDTVARLLTEAAERVNPSCYYDVVDVNLLDKSICVGATEFETGKIIAKLLKHSEKVALFVATAGMGFEHWAHELKERGDYLDVFVADSLGTCIVEKAGDYMERLLEKEIASGQKHTNRFSPGYCGWHVSEQRKLFSFFPSGICGVTLRESCLMTPIKSISGIIGIGAEVKTKAYSCNVCDMEYCYLRRNKRPSMVAQSQ